MNPDKIDGVFHYLKTGDAARIPAGVSFPELQAAARRIPKAEAGKFRGLAELRAALAETLKGRNILEYIEAGRPLVMRTRHVYDADEDPRQPDPWPEKPLLERLGFVWFLNSAVVHPDQHRPEAAQA
jgi:hypothetical protein